jgi:hypothetical protein
VLVYLASASEIDRALHHAEAGGDRPLDLDDDDAR